MANVWFVRREGSRWVAPGGTPAYRLPLSVLRFPFDLAPHRLLPDERPEPAAGLAEADPATLQRVMVEVTAEDLQGSEFCAFQPGVYDSPYSPTEAARRLAPLAG